MPHIRSYYCEHSSVEECDFFENGSFADLLLIDGDPTKDSEILTDKNNMRLIMKGGKVYKNTLASLKFRRK